MVYPHAPIFIILSELVLAAFTSISIDATVKHYRIRDRVQRGLFGFTVLILSLTFWLSNS
jgi:hypothetical protein